VIAFDVVSCDYGDQFPKISRIGAGVNLWFVIAKAVQNLDPCWGALGGPDPLAGN
jgi:hypothetical protein